MEDDLLPLEDDTTEQPSSKSFFLTEAQCTAVLHFVFFLIFFMKYNDTLARMTLWPELPFGQRHFGQSDTLASFSCILWGTKG